MKWRGAMSNVHYEEEKEEEAKLSRYTMRR
jgi:hypothetical protein